MRDSYRLQWVIDQETRGRNLGELDDLELRCVMQAVHRAHECLVDGVGFDEAGLVKRVE